MSPQPARNNIRLSDEEYVNSYRVNKDDESLGMLYTRYWRPMFLISKAILGNYQDASDATQDALCDLGPKILKTANIENFKGWITRITVNECRDLLAQNKKRRVGDIEKVSEILIQDPKVDYEAKEKVSKYINTLENINQVIALSLFYLQGMTMKEIMDEKKWTFKCVKANLQNGMKNLRKRGNGGKDY